MEDNPGYNWVEIGAYVHKAQDGPSAPATGMLAALWGISTLSRSSNRGKRSRLD